MQRLRSVCVPLERMDPKSLIQHQHQVDITINIFKNLHTFLEGRVKGRETGTCITTELEVFHPLPYFKGLQQPGWAGLG